MRKTETRGPRRRVRTPLREDGAQTRQQLLEVAGQVFAEHGYARATSKEICRRARANIAAVNYHFGGKAGLYAAVLEEAHARLVSVDFVASTVSADDGPAKALRALLSRIVSEVARRDAGAWELRVLSREILAPTPMMDRMVANQIVPKARLVSGMVASMLGLPANHPAVSRSIVNIIGPCVMMLIVSPEVLRKVFPSLAPDADSLVDHLVTFALGGLKAVAAKEKAR